MIVNHEVSARIPAQPGSGPEHCLHSARELIFALLFFALAWFEWHDTCVLPVTERVAHVLLFVNFGMLIALLGQVLLAWGKLPAGLVVADYGAMAGC